MLKSTEKEKDMHMSNINKINKQKSIRSHNLHNKYNHLPETEPLEQLGIHKCDLWTYPVVNGYTSIIKWYYLGGEVKPWNSPYKVISILWPLHLSMFYILVPCKQLHLLLYFASNHHCLSNIHSFPCLKKCLKTVLTLLDI